MGAPRKYIEKQNQRGDKPGELPIQGPRKFNLAVNLQKAKVFFFFSGLSIPESFLLSADKVIKLGRARFGFGRLHLVVGSPTRGAAFGAVNGSSQL